MPRLFAIALLIELAALLLAGLAATSLSPQGGGQWLANGIFALLLFAFALGTKAERLVPMRLFLAAALLLLPVILLAAVGLLMADEGIGLHFLDLVLRIGFIWEGPKDAWLPVLLVIWWCLMMSILIAAIGARTLILEFLPYYLAPLHHPAMPDGPPPRPGEDQEGKAISEIWRP
jgi:hypothetical protein